MADARRERGRLLAQAAAERIRHVEGALWFVPSQTAGGYLVDVAAATCACPDFAKGGAGTRCKHLWAVEFRRAADAAPDAAPAPVVPKPAPPLFLRGDLTVEEQRNVRAALRFLRTRLGGWDALVKATRLSRKTLENVSHGQLSSAGLAIRLARVAQVPVDDVLAGRWPAPGMCAHCGRGP